MRERQRMMREIRAGRECQLRTIVPVIRMTRFVVIIYSGGRVRATHNGVMRRIRMNSVVSAGLVVADVAVLCVDKKSVRRKNGSSKILHRAVNSLSVSTISSKLFWCLVVSDSALVLAPLFCPFWPAHPVDDKAE
jgi:hypothetical protein